MTDVLDQRRADGGLAPGESATAAGVTRWLLAGVACAAGIVGVAMLVAPGSTGRYFSWQLGPPAVAALVGALYVTSALVFGWAAWRERWTGQRGLCIAVLGLAGPTLVATAHHRDVFDFDRWQAGAWAVLFVASVTSFGTLVLRRPRRPAVVGGPILGPAARIILAAIAVAYGATAMWLWADPYWMADHGPVATGPLGLRFVGSWAAFLAIGAAYAASYPRWEEARTNVTALIAFPLAAAAAGVLHVDALRSGTPTNVAIVVLSLLTTAAAAARGLSRQRTGRRLAVPPTRGGAVR